jgi:hypothetical protein
VILDNNGFVVLSPNVQEVNVTFLICFLCFFVISIITFVVYYWIDSFSPILDDFCAELSPSHRKLTVINMINF